MWGFGNEPIIYSDSGPLVALTRGEIDMHYAGTVRVCNAIKRSGCRLITSPLALAETIGVVRKKTAISYKCRQGHDGDLWYADARVDEATTRAFKLARNLDECGFLIVVNIPGWTLDLPRVHAKMFEHPGRVVPGRGKFCRHLGIGSCDWPQIMLARDVGASAILTTDTAFADIVGSDSEFGHIKVQLTGEPLIDLLSGDGSGA